MLLQNIAKSVVALFPGLEIKSFKSPALPGLKSRLFLAPSVQLVVGDTQNQVGVSVLPLFVADVWLEMYFGGLRAVPDKSRDPIEQFFLLKKIPSSKAGEVGMVRFVILADYFHPKERAAATEAGKRFFGYLGGLIPAPFRSLVKTSMRSAIRCSG